MTIYRSLGLTYDLNQLGERKQIKHKTPKEVR